MAESPKRKSFPEIGRTGLVQFSGYIHEEYLRELQGPRWAKNVIEMTTNDPIVAAPFFAFDKFTRQVTWDVEANEKDPDGEATAQFIRECLDDMDQPWRETVGEIHSYLKWGFSLHEINYKVRRGSNPGTFTDTSGATRQRPASKFNDGRVGWAGWPIRAQESKQRWGFADNGDVTGMYQIAAPTYREVFIPMEKALLFRTTSHKNNPEGFSLCRPIFRPWYFKKHIQNLEAIGVERDFAGLPVIWAPPEIMDAEDGTPEAAIRDYLKSVITNLKNNEQAGLLFPSTVDEHGNYSYKFELASSGGQRQFDTRRIIQAYNLEIVISFLMDFLLMGHEKVGSFALADSKTAMFGYALGAFLDSDCETINRIAIPRLLALNGMSTEHPPRLIHGDIESIELETIANFISTMASAGYELTDPQVSYLFKQGGLPVPDDPKEMRKQQSAKPQPGTPEKDDPPPDGDTET